MRNLPIALVYLLPLRVAFLRLTLAFFPSSTEDFSLYLACVTVANITMVSTVSRVAIGRNEAPHRDDT